MANYFLIIVLLFPVLSLAIASDMELISELRTLLKGGNLRSGRQLEETEEMVSERLERQRLGGFEECTLVGFEFKRGEECEEVKEIDCYPVNVTKFTTELRDKCETIVDRHCELVTVQIPEQICKPIYKTSCETHYDIVKEDVYKEECRIEYDTACHQEYHQNVKYRGYSRRMRRDLENQYLFAPVKQGCYPVPRKECVKVPSFELRKVPVTSCHDTPEVECGHVLSPAQDVRCQPVVSRDCRKVAVELPYIKETTQCDEVVYDECQEVERRVPVDICKRRRFDEDSIFLSRGKVFRKEGEKRRKTLFRRNIALDSQRNNSTVASQIVRSSPNLPTSTSPVPPVDNNEPIYDYDYDVTTEDAIDTSVIEL